MYFLFSGEIRSLKIIVVQSRSSTVQIVNFYCPKLESVSSVLNCMLLALVQVDACNKWPENAHMPLETRDK